MLDIFLEVTPTAKGRPRLGKGGNAYTPAKTRMAEREIRCLLIAEINKADIKITEKPVYVKMAFHYPYPRKMSQHDKLLADLGMFYKVTRPDLDNLEKLILDSMNGLIFYDDNQVVKLSSEKIYSPREGVELKVLEL